MIVAQGAGAAGGGCLGAGISALGLVLGEGSGDPSDCGLQECEYRPAPGFLAKRPWPLLSLCLLICEVGPQQPQVGNVRGSSDNSRASAG